METKHPIVTIEVQGYAPMVLELYPEKAPNTVKNFIQLAKTGYYEKTVFHRIIKNFMIQGGAGKTHAREIKGEFRMNGVKNDLLHARGVLSMARTQVPDSASSQFFIMHKASPHLDGAYAAFGMMVSGFETLDAIASVPTGAMDKPLKDVVIAKVTVDTQGVDFGLPEYVR
jgi:peptidyl-prolyl cis-trans isomerase B (cyclophilin B)